MTPGTGPDSGGGCMSGPGLCMGPLQGEYLVYFMVWADRAETLYLGDDALSTKPVMHYQGTVYLCY